MWMGAGYNRHNIINAASNTRVNNITEIEKAIQQNIYTISSDASNIYFLLASGQILMNGAVVSPTNIVFKQMNIGMIFNTAVTDNNDVYLWNCKANEFKLITQLLDDDKDARDIKFTQSMPSKDEEYVLLVSDSGHLFRFGSKLERLNVDEIVQVSTGNHHNMAIDASGACYSWGSNNYSQCGIVDEKGSFAHQIDDPQCIEILRDDVQILSASCGASHSLLLSKDGDVYGMGSNKQGELGLDFVSTQLQPTLIEEFKGEEQVESVEQIACGSHYSILLSQGRIFATGNNSYGQLGLDAESTREFTQVRYIKPCKEVSIGLLWNTFFRI